GGPLCGKLAHRRVIFDGDAHGIIALVIVTAARDAEEFAPVVDRRGAIAVHRAVDHDGGFAGLVGRGDLADVLGIVGVGEALVVDDHVVGLGPVGIVVQRDLGA